METTVNQTADKLIRYILGSVLTLLALNAFGGGYYAMAGARDVPVEWLQGSPFSDYFIPGLFLFIVIGGSAATAAFAVFTKHRMARRTAFICGAVTLLWIVVQMSIIGYVSWMQPATTVTAVLILILTRQLPVKNNDRFSVEKNS